MNLRRHPCGQRGVGLIDALVAMLILCLGLLAMARFQQRLITQATDAQARLAAVQASDELLSTVLVDGANAACYTLPQSGECASEAAKERAADWAGRTAATLREASTEASLSAGRFTLRITWTAKEKADDGKPVDRELEVATDVRV